MTDLQIRPPAHLVPFTENPPGNPPPLPKPTREKGGYAGAAASALLIGGAAIASQTLDGLAWASLLGAAVLVTGVTGAKARRRSQ